MPVCPGPTRSLAYTGTGDPTGPALPVHCTVHYTTVETPESTLPVVLPPVKAPQCTVISFNKISTLGIQNQITRSGFM